MISIFIIGFEYTFYLIIGLPVKPLIYLNKEKAEHFNYVSDGEEDDIKVEPPGTVLVYC